VNIPNALTLARIILVPFIVWLIITHEMAAALGNRASNAERTLTLRGASANERITNSKAYPRVPKLPSSPLRVPKYVR
jgi:phosphatidylglycerophosphate synthase